MAGQWNNGATTPSVGVDRKGHTPYNKLDKGNIHVKRVKGTTPGSHGTHDGRWVESKCVGVGFHTLVRSSAIPKFLKSTAHICSLSPVTKHSELIRPTRGNESREACGCFLNPLSEGFGKCGVLDIEHGDGVNPVVALAPRGEVKDNGAMAPSTHPVAGGRGIVLWLSLSGIFKAMGANKIKDCCGGNRRGLSKRFCSPRLIRECSSPYHPTGFYSGTQNLLCLTLAGHLYVRPKNSTISHLEQIGSKLNEKVNMMISRLRPRSGILCYRLKPGFASCLGLSLEVTIQLWLSPPWPHRVSVKAAKAYHLITGIPWRWGQNIHHTSRRKKNGTCPTCLKSVISDLKSVISDLRTRGSVLKSVMGGLKFGTERCAA